MDFNTALAKHFKFKWRPVAHNMPIVTYMRRRRRTMGEVASFMGLAEMLRDMECRSGVEVGTYLGDSAVRWCTVNPKLRLTCVDPYRPYNARPLAENQEEIYQTAYKKLESYNATIMRLPSAEAVGKFADGSLDFVFIDGDHAFDAVMLDLILWVPKVRPGGMVLLHDYTILQGPGVVRAVDAYTYCHSVSPWYATIDYAPTVFWEKLQASVQ
jgi:predicted O-methyltransferase YrrM